MMMLVYLYKRQSKTSNVKHETFHNLNQCLLGPIIRCYRTKKIISAADQTAFRTLFLKNKCGLSGEAAIRSSKYGQFGPSDVNPDRVLSLLRTYGFTQPSISKIFSRDPRILQYCPEKILKPKLDFLLSSSLSQTEVIEIVTKNPRILCRSLNNHLIPFFNLLMSLTGCYSDAVAVIKAKPLILSYSISKGFLPNVEFLPTIGVPHSQILKLLCCYAQVLGQPHSKFRSHVLKVKEMGFDLTSSYFISAVKTLTFISDSTWHSRCDLLRSFGFSDYEILSLFKKLPAFMCFSDKNIRGRLDFFLNKLRWTPSRLSTNPIVMSYSLEKRTIPRCSVLQLLVLRNIITESLMLSTILAMTEQRFSKGFVTLHKDEIPEVVEAYHGKLRFNEYTFQQKASHLINS
ncbi:uncharacterized protein LOC108204973 isoform X3 [Daucus carota subsp. sativus]|uniref:uncharacterized protein LOC108204973 isoform X3 n=1 Tax=Daucus carota subsp. sativus TaxID=79200 RepID=UPI0007F02894|nr:PREDICTED: uncharacterized protein LOC108204973 isoform X3 [Daucus carota subsp. sativus]